MSARITWIRAGDRYPDIKTEDHFLALDGQEIVGVVRFVDSGPGSGRWLWSLVPVRPGRQRFPDLRSGTAETRREAARALVATWAEFRKWSGIEDA